jgi:hypothetical protein
MSILKKIDIFGTEFQFTIFNNKNFKTNLGGFCTLIAVLFAIILTLLFGRDLFFMDSPKIFVEDIIPNEYPKLKYLSHKNLLVAWRIKDQSGDKGSFENYLDLVVTNYSANGTGQIYKSTLESINCGKLNITDTIFLSTVNPNEWNCLNVEDKQFMFGGDQDMDEFNTFRIQVFPCATCTDFNKLTEDLGTSAFFEVIYPDHYYLGNSDNNPLSLVYNIHDQRINVGIKKKDKIHIKNFTSVDDRAWMFKDPDEKSILALGYYVTDYDYFTTDYFINNRLPLYECAFYFDKEKMLYSRSFMKLQNLAADVTGIINVVLLILAVLTKKYNHHKRKQFLFNDIFEFNKTDDNKR